MSVTLLVATGCASEPASNLELEVSPDGDSATRTTPAVFTSESVYQLAEGGPSMWITVTYDAAELTLDVPEVPPGVTSGSVDGSEGNWTVRWAAEEDETYTLMWPLLCKNDARATHQVRFNALLRGDSFTDIFETQFALVNCNSTTDPVADGGEDTDGTDGTGDGEESGADGDATTDDDGGSSTGGDATTGEEVADLPPMHFKGDPPMMTPEGCLEVSGENPARARAILDVPADGDTIGIDVTGTLLPGMTSLNEYAFVDVQGFGLEDEFELGQSHTGGVGQLRDQAGDLIIADNAPVPPIAEEWSVIGVETPFHARVQFDRPARNALIELEVDGQIVGTAEGFDLTLPGGNAIGLEFRNARICGIAVD